MLPPTQAGKQIAETGFNLAQFVIDWEKQQVRCPMGQTSRSWRNCRDCRHTRVIEVNFHRKTCASCPVRSNCTRSKTAARKLKLRPREEYLALHQRRDFQKTPEFETLYARRAGIEGTISQGVRQLGLRRTRYFGLAKTHLQHVATACAMNLLRFFAWSQHIPKAKTRITSFATLRVSSI